MRWMLAICLLAGLYIACNTPSSKQETNPVPEEADSVLLSGKELFVSKCASCHMVNKEMTGPALRGVEDRWPDKNKLYAFIRNSQQVIQEDAYAHDLWLEFNQTIMTEHKDLTDDNIAAILRYINSVSQPVKP